METPGLAPRSVRSASSLRCSTWKRMGLTVLERNWRCRYGELDVIALDEAARVVVFVEVKARTTDRFGGADRVRRRPRTRSAGCAPAGGAMAGRWGRKLVGVRIDVDRGAVRPYPYARTHAPAGGRLMALGRAFAVAIRGLDGITVEIEADISGGLPGVHLVGLPDTALQESRDRVRAAITNCGNSWPDTRLTALALSSATLPKVGSMYDLALASARALGAPEEVVGRGWRRRCCWESSHSTAGSVRSTACCPRCWPPSATAGRRWWCPSTTWPRPSLVDGVEVWGVQNLRQLRTGSSGKAGQLAGRITGRRAAHCPAGVPGPRGPDRADGGAGGGGDRRRGRSSSHADRIRRESAKPCSRNGCRDCCRH